MDVQWASSLLNRTACKSFFWHSLNVVNTALFVERNMQCSLDVPPESCRGISQLLPLFQALFA